jgi:DNA (cytosine-5)-methyltransferase 1
MENVPMVHGEGNKKDFQKWIEFLESKGYTCWWEDMNAKDYGVAQSRDRCFMVSILGNYQYKFPNPIPLIRKMKDYLELEVDESFYISEERAKQLINDLINKDTLMIDVCQYKREGHPREYNEIAPTLSARYWKDPRLIQVGCLDIKGQDIVKRVYSSEGLSPTLTNMQGGNRQPKVIEGPRVFEEQNEGVVRIREATKKGYAECKVGGVADLLYPTLTTRRGRVQDMGETCPTIVSGENGLHRIESMYRIRKLTPKECWRLMDFSDEDFEKAAKVNSNTQLYKQAGNSIVKNCLVAIFGQMIPGKENVYKERFNERTI